MDLVHCYSITNWNIASECCVSGARYLNIHENQVEYTYCVANECWWNQIKWSRDLVIARFSFCPPRSPLEFFNIRIRLQGKNVYFNDSTFWMRYLFYIRSLELKEDNCLWLAMRMQCGWSGAFRNVRCDHTRHPFITTVFPAYLFIHFVACTCHIGHFSIVVPLFLPFRRFVFSFNGKLCSYANRKQNWFMNDQLCYWVYFGQSSGLSKLFCFQCCVIHTHTQLLHSVSESQRCCNYYLHFIVHFMFKRLKMSARPLSHGTQSEDTCSS